jgi:hypothetical protein
MANLDKKFRANTSDKRMGEREVSTRGGGSDIPAFVAGRPVKDMLKLYETRFLPAAAGQLAAAQFQTAAQMDGEQKRSLACAFENNIRTSFSGRKYPKFETSHQQICPETGRLQH